MEKNEVLDFVKRMKPRGKKDLKKQSKTHVKYTLIERKKTAHMRVRRRFKTTRRKLSAVKAREATAGERSLTNLETLVDNLPDATFVKDKDHRYVLVNKPFCAFLGKRKDQVLGKTAQDLYPKDVADISEKSDEEVFELGITVDSRERERPDAQGVARILHTRKAPLKDAEGNVTHLIGISRDITERKRMEERLKKSEEQYRELAESITDMLFVMDRDLRYTYWNKASETGTGISAENAVGKTLREVFPPSEGRRIAEETYLKAMRKQQPQSFVNRFTLRNREYFFEISAFPTRSGVAVIAKDITERKRMEDELRRSEERFRKIFHSSPIPYLISSREGPILDVNDAWVRMSGYSREEAIGHSTIELGMAQDPGQRGQMMKDLLEKGRVSNIELTRRTKSGELRDLLNTIELVELDGEKCILNMQVDITERKRMETELKRHAEHLEELVEARTVELKASEEKHRLLVNNLTDAVFTIDLKGNITFCSQAGEKMTGYPVQQLLSMKITDVIAPEDMAEIQRRLEARIRGEKNLPPHQFEIIRADGKRLEIEMVTSTIAKEGNLIGIQGIARDITERRQIEKEAQAASRYARGLIEASLDPLVTISPDGKITDANKATELVTEFTRDQLMGTDFSNYFTDPEKAKQGYREVFSRGFVKDYALAIRSKSGKVTDVLYNATSFKDETGKTQGVFAAARDVTERREMDRLREQATASILEDAIRRKELEKMKNQFISAVTHELRTPLVSMKGYMDLALSAGPGQMSKEVESRLQVVKRNTDRLLSLVNDLLDVQRMQAGRLQLEIQPTDFNKVVDSCLTEIQPLLEEKKLSLRLEVPEGELRIEGDQARLCQALMNLLSNAAKFSPEGSEVTLHVEEENESIKVQVSDKGIGIRKEDLKRVFEPFTAIEKPTYVKGTGLGLSITKGLVESHGGRIWAVSEGEGKGATFSFTIPKRKEVA